MYTFGPIFAKVVFGLAEERAHTYTYLGQKPFLVARTTLPCKPFNIFLTN